MLRNEKYHKALRGEYTPTIWEAVELIDQWLSLWSTKTECPHVPGKTIRQVFDEGKGEGMPQDELDDLMLDRRFQKFSERHSHVGRVLLARVARWQEIDDVTVRYSIFEKSTVRVQLSGALICTAASVDRRYEPQSITSAPRQRRNG
jgi:hypothetical protein